MSDAGRTGGTLVVDMYGAYRMLVGSRPSSMCTMAVLPPTATEAMSVSQVPEWKRLLLSLSAHSWVMRPLTVSRTSSLSLPTPFSSAYAMRDSTSSPHTSWRL